VVVRREPEELLLDALHDTDATLQALKSQLWELGTSSGAVNPAVLEAIGDWLDRVTRIAKVITDGDLPRKLAERHGWQAADRGAQLTGLLAAVLQAAPLSAGQRLATWESRFDGIQLVMDGRAPLRMVGEETARFTDELMMAAAAAEQAAAEGIMWPDPEPDADLGEVVPLFGVDGHG
jgi:hypothetical protein